MRIVTTLLWVTAFGSLQAADPPQIKKLPDIPRKIAVEPKYADRPAYLLLTFGEQFQDRVWVVADGQRALYVDRNGNGDLTDDGPPVPIPQNGSFKVETRNPTATNDDRRPVRFVMYNRPESQKPMVELSYDVSKEYELIVRRTALGLKAESAPIFRFGGPMEIGLLNNRRQQLVVTEPTQLKLYRGARDPISAWIGTASIGDEAKPVAVNFCRRDDLLFARRLPLDERPMLKIEFPAKPGQKPVVEQIRLEGD